MGLHRKTQFISVVAAGLLLSVDVLAQQTVTFDGVTVSGSSVSIDLDADSNVDLVISSPSSTAMSISNGNSFGYTSEPSLAHPSVINAEFRIDFENGLSGPLSLDLTTDWGCGNAVGIVDNSLTFTVELFETGNATPVASTVATAECLSPANTSDFAEVRIQLGTGTTSDYALINYNDATVPSFGLVPIMTIDNITGNFLAAASAARGIPSLPTPALGLLAIFTALLGAKYRKRR